MFDINLTIIIQFVNFAVTLVVLNVLLIRPIRGIVKKRRDLASGMIGDTKTFIDDAREKLSSYEAALAKARAEAAAVRGEAKRQAALQEADMLRKAQAEAQEYLKHSRDETRKAVEKTMADMQKRTPDLARLAVSRLLGAKAV
jgi:F-type H+-transporting ATPase subunit b